MADKIINTYHFDDGDSPRWCPSHEFLVVNHKIVNVDEWSGNYSGGTIWTEGESNGPLNRALANAEKWDKVKYRRMMDDINKIGVGI